MIGLTSSLCRLPSHLWLKGQHPVVREQEAQRQAALVHYHLEEGEVAHPEAGEVAHCQEAEEHSPK